MKRTIAVIGVVLAIAVAALAPVDAETKGPESGLGPKGEIPKNELNADDYEYFSKASGMTMEDTKFILGDGGAAIVAFVQKHENNGDFGDVRVTYHPDPLVELRTTVDSPSLKRSFERSLGRRVEHSVGGRSRAELQSDLKSVGDLFTDHRVGSDTADLRYEATIDFESGAVVVTVNSEDASKVRLADFPSQYEIRTRANLEPDSALSFAGIDRQPTCTIAYAAKTATNTGGVATAGHCGDDNQTAYGFALGGALGETCSTSDRQIHVTQATFLWDGFYDLVSTWTNIHAVAGGAYEGQPFFRRGKNTIAAGTVGAWDTDGFNGGDCGSYDAFGLELFNFNDGISQSAVGGDSGGPVMFLYGGQYYLGGHLTGGGNNNPDGFAAFRDIPFGWTPCTNASPCGQL